MESNVLRFEHADRRRMLMASAITMVALPSLLLMSRHDDSAGAPNLATAGVAVAPDAPTTEPNDTSPPAMGVAGGAFLEPPDHVVEQQTHEVDPRIVIAVPAPRAGTSSFARATFKSTFSDPGSCLVLGAPYAARITVTNLDNGRQTSCIATVSPAGSRDDVVLHTSAFLQIADLTASPVPVEINW